MSRAKDVRERWITEVLRTDAVGLSCKVVLLAMSRHMTERGRVSWPRDKIAAEVGLATPQRVTDRIAEAKRAGLIDVVHSGHKGMTATYEAMLPRPKAPRGEVPSQPIGNGWRGGFDGVPLSRHEAPKPPRDGDPNARATSRTRAQGPAPDGSRGPGPHHPPNSSSDGGEATTDLVATARPSAPTTRQEPDARTA